MEEPGVFATLRWFTLGSPNVPVVQPSESHMRKNATWGYGASSAVWRSLPGSEMRAALVIVANILRDQAFQVAFVNCDDVIQEITAATPYPTLCNSILPRTFERDADRIHTQGSNRRGDFQSILGITIKDDEPRSGSKWKCFSQLLDDPQACRMLGDVEVQDAPTIVTDDEKAVEHRSETSKPSMRSLPWMRGAPHVGFSTTIRKINSRTSFDVCRLPTAS
jgi:hypothetical protein